MSRINRNGPRPGQVGKYWLSKKSGRNGTTDAWCRTWFEGGQTRRLSLGTADFQEASKALASWVILNESAPSGRTEDVLIETVLLKWWEKHGKLVTSAAGQKINLRYWQDFWAGKTVADITPHAQEQFRAWLGPMKTSSIDRVLSTGRAALRRAVKYQELNSAPHIFRAETHEERESREPMGKPVSIDEMARMFMAAEAPHLLVFMIIAANTLARPGAIFDLQKSQFNEAEGTLRLNPAGRIQNKKRRPILPVTPTLRPWLQLELPGSQYYVSRNGERLGSIKKPFEVMRKKAGLPTEVNRYSFRHGMAQALQDLSVPRDQISYVMGHRYESGAPTTAIYARFKPEHCGAAVAGIERIMAEIQKGVPDFNLQNPTEALAVVHARRRVIGSALSASEASGVRAMLLAGNTIDAVAERYGVTTRAIYKHRRRLALEAK